MLQWLVNTSTCSYGDVERGGANCKTDRKVAKIATTLKAALYAVPKF